MVETLGDYYFASSYYEHRGEIKRPRDKIKTTHRTSNEVLGGFTGETNLAYKYLGEGSCGIWWYETCLWNPKELKQELESLIREVDKFDQEYQEKMRRCGLLDN